MTSVSAATSHYLSECTVEADQTLADRTGRFRLRQLDADYVELEGTLEAGDYLMSLETRAGTLPTEELMLHLVEWPTLERVPCGPFDFDHTEYRMVVPTFRCYVDGQDEGLVWAEVPSPEDVAARRLRAEWGLHITDSGRHTIRLERPEQESRLQFSDLERLAIEPNPRQPRATASRRPDPLARPRLAADGAQFARLAQARDEVQEVIFQDLVKQLESSRDLTYGHRTVTAALVGRIGGQQRWIDEAIERAMQTCDRPHWGYHDVPEIMGWNNDRDTGMRLFETAIVFDWLGDYLTATQRERLRERLVHFAGLVERVTRLQHGYWYNRSAEAHGHGVWFGFTAAAIALLGEDPRAERWLDWAHGNIVDSIEHLPADGIVTWPVFNIQWLIMTTMLLEQYTGEPLEVDDAPLRSFARSISHHLPGWDNGLPSRGVLPLLLFFLAARHTDSVVQADALVATRPQRGAGNGRWHFHPLALLAYRPEIATGEPTKPAKEACALNGNVVCASDDGRVRLVFECGTPLTRDKHELQPWIAQSWYGAARSGSFGWTVDDVEVIPTMVKTYRKVTGLANVITVDGGGHITHGRYLGGRIPVEQTSRILRYAHLGSATFCDTDNQPSYDKRCGLRTLRRQWVFLHRAGLLAVRDLVEFTEPHLPAWHLNCNGKLAADGELVSAEHRGARLWVRAHLCQPASTTLQRTIERAHYVPTYTQGLNRYRTQDWQPEINIERRPPDYAQLVLAPAEPVERFELLTLIGPGAETLGAAETLGEPEAPGWRIPGVGELRWPTGPWTPPGLDVPVQAGAALRESMAGADAWLLFALQAESGWGLGAGELAAAAWTPGQRSPEPG